MSECVQWFAIVAVALLVRLVVCMCEKLERRIDELERKGESK